MSLMLVDSSSDDEYDDAYTNAAARLKALKTHHRHTNNLGKLERSHKISNDERADGEFSVESIEQLPRNNEDSMFLDNVSTNIKVTFHQRIVMDDDQSMNRFPFSNKIEHSVRSDNSIDTSDVIINDEDISTSSADAIQITVRWKSRVIERLELQMNEDFRKIFDHFAMKEKIPRNQILLLKKDVPVRMNDTPASIDLSVIDILEGGIINADMTTLPDDICLPETRRDVTGCMIKVQTSRKQSLTLRLNRNENFERLAIYCAEKLGLPKSKFKFFCDGERIMDSDTPNNLDFDDEACVDLTILT